MRVGRDGAQPATAGETLAGHRVGREATGGQRGSGAAGGATPGAAQPPRRCTVAEAAERWSGPRAPLPRTDRRDFFSVLLDLRAVSRFSDCFLLLFGQLAAGGVAGLTVPPFTVLDRGFYRSSAGIYLGFAILFLAGKVALLARTGSASGSELLELAAWAGFVVALGVYVASLWRESNRFRARSFAAALLLGVVALIVSALRFQVGPWLGAATVLYPLAIVSGALVLGAVATGMLLGHWYLIDVGLSLDPLERLFRYFVAVLVLQLAVACVTLGAVALTSSDGATAVLRLWDDHRPLLLTRLILGPVAALGVAWLIHRTLKIPQTMAATGLFYIAMLAVLVGEMLGRLILFRTSLPL